MNQAWWRRWHRWVGFVASLFLLFASLTGVAVAVSEFFGEEEARREAPSAPIDRIVVQFKGDATIDVFLGRPIGGEDRRLVIDAQSGSLERVEGYVDKPFLHRLHSGEAFGDGGLVVAMIWGLGLAFLSGSGLLIYVRMRRRNPEGLQKVFW